MFKKLPLKAKLSLIFLPVLIIALALGYYLSQQETSTQSFASSCDACYDKCRDKYPGEDEDDQKSQRHRCRVACRERLDCPDPSPKPTCPPDARCGDGSCQPACDENSTTCRKDCGN